MIGTPCANTVGRVTTTVDWTPPADGVMGHAVAALEPPRGSVQTLVNVAGPDCSAVDVHVRVNDHGLPVRGV